MTGFDVVALGGLACGAIAGAAAQYGRLCTFAAIEDALAGGDLRRARAFALALAVAILGTLGLTESGVVNPWMALNAAPRLEMVTLVLGALLFGLGMALVGTCGFGLLVRAGAGDLRAVMMAVVVGIAAFAASAGPLASPRRWLTEVGTITWSSRTGGTLTSILGSIAGPVASSATAVLIAMSLAAFAISSVRLRQRPKLVASAVALGLAVAGGWLVTGALADPFAGHRVESLTFVAPIGRLLLVTMGESLTSAAFGVSSVVGVIVGSLGVATARRELRWEAFDDHREMRRHIAGAVLMGVGGVLTRGCTIGQGLSAGSLLAVSAPIAVLGFVLGARLGLAYLIGGPSVAPARRPWAR